MGKFLKETFFFALGYIPFLRGADYFFGINPTFGEVLTIIFGIFVGTIVQILAKNYYSKIEEN